MFWCTVLSRTCNIMWHYNVACSTRTQTLVSMCRLCVCVICYEFIMWRKYIGATTERSLTPPALPRRCSRLDKYIFACHSTAASANWQLKSWTPAQAEAQAHARSWNVLHIFWHFQYLARHIINTLTDSDASLITNFPQIKKLYENNWTEIQFCWRRQEMQLIIRYVRWYDMIRYDLWLWLTFFLARLTPVVSALTWVQHPGADPDPDPGRKRTFRVRGPGQVSCDLLVAFCEAANPMGFRLASFSPTHISLCCG